MHSGSTVRALTTTPESVNRGAGSSLRLRSDDRAENDPQTTSAWGGIAPTTILSDLSTVFEMAIERRGIRGCVVEFNSGGSQQLVRPGTEFGAWECLLALRAAGGEIGDGTRNESGEPPITRSRTVPTVKLGPDSRAGSREVVFCQTCMPTHMAPELAAIGSTTSHPALLVRG